MGGKQMKQRKIGVVILLTIITFGIYAVVWQCSFQNQLKKETGLGFSGAGHFFMCIFTFGIYPIYWSYAAGKRLQQLGASDKAILYLVLTFVGFGFVNMFILQDDANKLEQKVEAAQVEDKKAE